jgi:hypothetical protein
MVLHYNHHMKKRESQEDLYFSCWGHLHCPCYICNFLSSILLILQVTLGHQTVDLIIMVYVQYTTLCFRSQVLPNVSL